MPIRLFLNKSIACYSHLRRSPPGSALFLPMLIPELSPFPFPALQLLASPVIILRKYLPPCSKSSPLRSLSSVSSSNARFLTACYALFLAPFCVVINPLNQPLRLSATPRPRPSFCVLHEMPCFRTISISHVYVTNVSTQVPALECTTVTRVSFYCPRTLHSLERLPIFRNPDIIEFVYLTCASVFEIIVHSPSTRFDVFPLSTEL